MYFQPPSIDFSFQIISQPYRHPSHIHHKFSDPSDVKVEFCKLGPERCFKCKIRYFVVIRNTVGNNRQVVDISEDLLTEIKVKTKSNPFYYKLTFDPYASSACETITLVREASEFWLPPNKELSDKLNNLCTPSEANYPVRLRPPSAILGNPNNHLWIVVGDL